MAKQLDLFVWKARFAGFDYWWNSKATGILVLAATTITTIWCVSNSPSVGMSIGILGAVGVIMTTREHIGAWEKAIYIICITALVIAEILAIRRNDQEVKNDREAQICRLKGISTTANKAINTLTGGDDLYYVVLGSDPDPKMKEVVPALMVKGGYPVPSLTVRVLDYRAYRRDVSKFIEEHGESARSLVQLDSTTTTYQNIPPTGTLFFNPIGIDVNADATEKNYNIEFYALNGNSREYLRARKVNGMWYCAIRVVRIENLKEVMPPAFETIDEHLPRDANGQFDWR